jgi:site-specific recombinase XerD
MYLQPKLDKFYMEMEYRGKSEQSIKSYKSEMKLFKSFCREYKVNFIELDLKQAKAFRNYLSEYGLKPNTINRCLSTLKAFYEYLVDEEIISRNPVNTSKLRVKVPDTLPSFLTECEKSKVIRYFEKQPDNIRLAFMLMLTAGLRIGECAALKTQDVFIQGNAYLVHVRHGKGAKERLAPITDKKTAIEVMEFAKSVKDRSSLFGLTLESLGYQAQKCRLVTGVKFHSHRLRHTFATELLHSGVPIDVVQEALGHASIKTTRTYAKTSPTEIIKLATHI